MKINTQLILEVELKIVEILGRVGAGKSFGDISEGVETV